HLSAMAVFPSTLTEEEESLQKKYAKLKKKVKKIGTNLIVICFLQALSDQPVVDTATATEQAKMLIKSGAISAIKSENKNSGFKRSRTLEGKLKDPEKGPVPAFLPFQRSISTDEDPAEAAKRAHRKSLYESVRKGNTVYVYGAGLVEDSLRTAFAQHGTIIDLSMDSPRNCAFVTFEKMESADQAVTELNGTTVGDVTVKVSIARKQPMLDAATGKSVWASLAVQNSAKGSYRDKRNQVVYTDFI
uniref:Negative elongation factor E n=1 Tax=Astyanax mexicanus TaxID=7994 RepID=A0A8B9R9G2_ASTMX